jgi:hypothetical protein
MELSGLAARARDVQAREVLTAKVTDTDDIIRALRSAIFDLSGRPDA